MIKKLAGRVRTFLFISIITALSASASTGSPVGKAGSSDGWGNFWEGVAEFFGWTHQATQWKDIQSWKPIGKRFALGQGSKGEALAVYDLSYPSFLAGMTGVTSSSGKVVLGRIGVPGAQEELKKLWNKMNAVGDAQTLSKKFKSVPDSWFETAALPQGWWKSLPWKDATKGDRQPADFHITDLDLKQISFPAQATPILRNLFGLITENPEGIAQLSDDAILGIFEFTLGQDGSYQIGLNFPQMESAQSDVPKPRKLLDLAHPRAGLYENIKVDLAAEAVKEAFSFIPINYVGALLSTAISRLSRYYDMTLAEHLEMMREQMVANDEGSNIDPSLDQLAAPEKQFMIQAEVWTRDVPEDFWTWLWGNPGDDWSSEVHNSSSLAQVGKNWLNQKGMTLTDVNSRFTIGVEGSGKRNLYLLSKSNLGFYNGPEVSINYADPSSVAVSRAFIEILGTAECFASHMMGISGIALDEAWSLMIQDGFDSSQYWDARLTQALESTEGLQSNTELAILQGQRINPLEIERNSMNQLVQQRRKLLGI